MKTLLQSLTVSAAIYSVLFILIAGISYGAKLNFHNNEHVDSTKYETVFAFEEEEYIDDIPFNTETIATNYLYEKSMNTEYQFEEEAYVEDIPFDTQKIAAAYSETLALIK